MITLSLPQVNAFTLGQLFYLFEVAVVFAAGLYRINPFNQPGVEAGKRLTYGQVGPQGVRRRSAPRSKRTWRRKRPDYML